MNTFKRIITFLLIFVTTTLTIVLSQTLDHDIGREINNYTLVGRPTSFPGVVYDSATLTPVSGVDVFYELNGTEIYGMIRSDTNGEFDISFVAPSTPGMYVLKTNATKAGYTYSYKEKIVNVYEGVLKATLNIGQSVYEPGQSVTFDGEVTEIGCCFYAQNSTEDCACDTISDVTINYYVNDELKGSTAMKDDQTYSAALTQDDVITGLNELLIEAVKTNYATSTQNTTFYVSSISNVTTLVDFTDAQGNPITATLEIYNDTTTIVSTSFSGAQTFEFPQGTYNVKVVYGDYEVIISDGDFTSSVESLIKLSLISLSNPYLPINLNNIQKAIAIETGLTTYSSVTLKISYDDSGFNEGLAQVMKCSSWSFSDETCSSAWSIISSSTDTSNNVVTVSMTSLSGFALGEGEETCSYSNCETHCTTQTECESVGCNWCDNTCLSTPCSTCHKSNPSACTSLDECYEIGGYWCDGVCTLTPCCDPYHLSECNDSSSCEAVNGTWCLSTNTCGAEPCCDELHLSECTTFESCVYTAGGDWCKVNGTEYECRSTCVTTVTNEVIQYVYVNQTINGTSEGSDSTSNGFVSYEVIVTNPYSKPMLNTTITLLNVSESNYTVVPQDVTVEPNSSQKFVISVDPGVVESMDQLTYSIGFNMLDEEEELSFFNLFGNLDVNLITLFADLKKLVVPPGEDVEIRVRLSKTWETVDKVELTYQLLRGNAVLYESNDQQFLKDELAFDEKIPTLSNYTEGKYYLKIKARISDKTSYLQRELELRREFPWLLFLVVIVVPALIIGGLLLYYKIRKPPKYVTVPAIEFGE